MRSRRWTLFHVVRSVGGPQDRCRQRVQQNTHRRRGRASDPLYRDNPVATFGRTLERADDVLAYCDRLGTSQWAHSCDQQSSRIRLRFTLGSGSLTYSIVRGASEERWIQIATTPWTRMSRK